MRAIKSAGTELGNPGATSGGTNEDLALGKGGAYSGSQVMSGFAKAATVTQISALNAKNWATADTTDQIIPAMMKSLMRGANFTATVNKVGTQLQNVLNTGSES